MKTKFPLIVAAFVALTSLAACGGSDNSAPPVVLTYAGNPTALTKTDTTVGTGTEAVAGKWVKVTYTGWLYNQPATNKKGTQFDTGTFPFKLGANEVIPGFDQGVTGMKVGGKRTVIIPSNLAYGAGGNGPMIPPNAGLVFDIELLQVSDTKIN
ncbi:FKBP-type peptidyl-prolyl cis-trans isomerase [Pseudoduganella sp. GCM10020061]|uniref:FKBP-type peptidyl-prolyl cis-trans isomerase n=1 Tax=Pseudoduganella sp. GCM10020061 TaxID=3317345 RepID=UPI00363400A9